MLLPCNHTLPPTLVSRGLGTRALFACAPNSNSDLSALSTAPAGKTTLLDVIAGRKNSGKMEGSIFLNGFPKEQKSFARLTAYVEQMDIHSPLTTVKEALEFSAALRLPASVTAAARAAFVLEVIQMLELDDIADRKIGDMGAADGLSPGQRKRLTIGVELVSNAPILFLDEPTTGLDSRAASVVVRVIKKIAQSGRTVITTIHQPSAELFFMMDNLLLLQRGGHQVYIGPVGPRGRNVVRYLESIPGTPRCPKRMNPASWMLDVLAGTDSSGAVEGGPVQPAGSHHGATGHTATASGAMLTLAANSTTALTNFSGTVENDIQAGTLAMERVAATEIARLQSNRSADIIRSTSTGSSSVAHLTIPPGAIDYAREPPSDKSTGPVDYQLILQSSPVWKQVTSTITTLSTPAPNAVPYKFDSLYAHGFWYQFATIFGRNQRSYYRNVEYNYMRIMVLAGLLLLFGVIYYKLDSSDLGGVQ